MRNALGYLLWLLAIAITVVVVLAKFKIYQVPVAADMLRKDSEASLLVAIFFSLIAKWL